MARQRIQILGAPGSGVTTLGGALAAALGLPFFDSDDYYWFTDDLLPYRRKRNPDHRMRLLRSDLEKTDSFVLSGALLGWGAAPDMDAVIYRWLPANIRYTRIETREAARYGAARLASGGDLNGVYTKFQAWAAGYDTADGNLRSRSAELNWLAQLTCPVLRMECDVSVEELLAQAQLFLQQVLPS